MITTLVSCEKLQTVKYFYLCIFLLLLFNSVLAESEVLATYIERYELNPAPIKSFSQEIALLSLVDGELVLQELQTFGLSEALYFNKNGYVTAKIFFDTQGQVYWERFYDSRCNKESAFYRYKRTGIELRLNAFTENEYDFECNSLREVRFYYDELYYIPHPLQADENGDIISFQRYQHNGMSSETVFNRLSQTLEQFSYDQNGNVTYYKTNPATFDVPIQDESVTENTSEKIEIELDGSITYWYDEKLHKREILNSMGQVVEEFLYTLDGNIMGKNRYSNKGHLIERISLDKNGDITYNGKCTYEYDVYDNWIEKTCWTHSVQNESKISSNENNPWKMVRKIEYY